MLGNLACSGIESVDRSTWALVRVRHGGDVGQIDLAVLGSDDALCEDPPAFGQLLPFRVGSEDLGERCRLEHQDGEHADCNELHQCAAAQDHEHDFPPHQASCNHCVRFATTVAGGHATLATKRTLLLTWAGLPPAGRTSFAWGTHSITSSARARSVAGTVRPRTLAVLMFSAKMNLFGAWIGKSPG